MNNVKVQTKLIIVMLTTIVALVLCAIISSESMKQLQSKALETLEADERASYDEQIKQQVDNVISLCQTIYDQYQAGVYTEEEAKKLAADEIRQLRYGDAGYFWVDQYDGTNVVLLGNDTEGTNRMETKDANGYQMVKEIIRVGQEADGGYTDYVFPKEGETEPSPKRSYSKAFEPFGWVIGTGNYTDYIDDQVASIEKDFSSYVTGRMTLFIISTLIEGIIVVLLLIMIIISIIRPLKKCISSIGVMEQGDFSQAMGTALLKRRDDFGKLAASLESMRNEMSGLIGEVKSQATEITRMVQEIDDNIQALDEEIENVSATTEELAAGMEETAASSEEINAMSHEIESAAKSIATRSQEGAQQAADIHKRASEAQTTARKQREHVAEVHRSIREGLTKALEDAGVVKQIEVLSSSIMEITSQTNLLALNASIEAARAGDAGRGFAVVATEIGGLAEQSKEAVVKIQQVTEAVTASVERLSEDAGQLLEFVGGDVVASYDMFDKVVDAYNQDAKYIDMLIGDFSATSEELLASIDGVLSSMDGIATATNEGAKGTTDIAQKTIDVKAEADSVTAEVERCDETAKKLMEEIGVFKI